MDVFGVGAVAGEGRHYYAVGERGFAYFDGIEERRHCCFGIKMKGRIDGIGDGVDLRRHVREKKLGEELQMEPCRSVVRQHRGRSRMRNAV